MLDLSLAANIASDLLERTADTPRVLRAVQLSLAPAFLLVGIGSIMNVIMARVTWIAGRIERLCETSDDDHTSEQRRELDWLKRRRVLARSAIKFATAAAVVISIVIALLFVSAYIETRLGTIVAVLWVTTVVLLIIGLFSFLRETLMASEGPREQRWRKKKGEG
ncbi:GTP-binding protein [Erythrobacter sp. KY5]|uniref:DUF2721 domain-containing protein n=1 Tax=Erythrobacter sp. KY5 TaxID=2011159 RepID=UPI000DBF0827|nr:DUF2721 domain-containing protein [Erythrobacter sp. KY5]AWW73859.1 GTP-binding protein [Erythrobacter sp. KY5]